MTKRANRRLMSKDDRIHGEMRVEYALIPAAFAIVVYDVFAPMSKQHQFARRRSGSWLINARRAAFARLKDPKKLRGGGRMNRIMIVLGCLLGLALACIPAYASPTDKKITLSCDVSAGSDIITGTATVTLCAESGKTTPCTGATFDCP